MIKIEELINILKKSGTNFFTGVPDSILKELSIKLNKEKTNKHIIAVNEGAAVSIGIGYYLSQKKIPCVYMQNSGLSNAINPLISIADNKVYSIPLILLIGWRGSPFIEDEAQHKVKGKITKKILDLLKIKHVVIKDKKSLLKFKKLTDFAKKNKTTVAGLIPQGVIKKSLNKIKNNDNKLDKITVLKIILKSIKKESKVISSTGYNSREILYVRKKYNLKNGRDFYMVGGMGHTSSVALGYSAFSRNKKVICIDGDGSLLMHLGALKTVSDCSLKNFKYILFNNNAHDSVGGQTTNAENINFPLLSKSLGFKKFYSIANSKEVDQKIKVVLNNRESTFLEIKVANNRISELPRPDNFKKIKKLFMKKFTK